MGIKVSAGLSSHLNALRKNPRPGLRLLAASTQFLAAVGLRRSVPVGCQQGALSERIQAPPPFRLTVLPTFKRPRCVSRPPGASGSPRRGPCAAVLPGPLSSPRPLSCVRGRDSVSLSTPGTSRLSLPPLRGLWGGALSELVPGPEAPGHCLICVARGPSGRGPGPSSHALSSRDPPSC